MLLVPTGILIVLVLAAITIDAAVGFMAEREAANIASAAANDIATLGIDVEHFRATGEYRLRSDLGDPIDAVTAAAVAQAGSMFIPGSFSVDVVLVDDATVRVHVVGRVDRLVLGSVSDRPFDIGAIATATAGPRN